MALRDDAAACLKAQAGQAIRTPDLARRMIEREPEKFRAKLAASRRLKTMEDLIHQIGSELAAERYRLLALYPNIRSESIKRKRTYIWTAKG